jgi:serine/threonine-protein kinase RsbW
MQSASTLQITAKIANLDKIREFVECTAAGFQVPEDAVFDVALAVYEAASNIIEHGYRGVPGEIEIEINHNGDSLVISLRDRAPVFDPTRLPAPDLSLPLERRQIGGLGVFMMQESVDQLRHKPLPEGGNELVLVKRGVVKT